MITISHRSLTHDEAQILHEELKSTPNILGYTVRELERLTDVYVAEVDGQLAGLCFSIDLAAGWTEIAALYVLPEFRGERIGKQLFQAAWDRAQERQRHVYILSRNPQVASWMKTLGMTVGDKIWQAPLAVHWYMARYMASRHRHTEGFRKRNQIRLCPPLLQGIMKYRAKSARAESSSGSAR